MSSPICNCDELCLCNLPTQAELTPAEIVARVANCLVTARRCFGRGKSARCMESYTYWIDVAHSRGIELPSVAEMESIGQFNGPGAA